MRYKHYRSFLIATPKNPAPVIITRGSTSAPVFGIESTLTSIEGVGVNVVKPEEERVGVIVGEMPATRFVDVGKTREILSLTRCASRVLEKRKITRKTKPKKSKIRLLEVIQFGQRPII